MVAAVAIFAAVSCNKEFEQENLPVGETVVYTASTDLGEDAVNPESKASINTATRKSEWDSNDEITVHDGNKGWKFTSTGDGAHVDFVNNEGGFGDYRPVMAVYPAGNWSADVAAKTVNAYIPTWQQANMNTYHEPAALAVAYSEGNSFAFKNAHALLKFTVLTENVTHVIFCGNNGEAVTGNVKVTLGKDGVEAVECLATDFTEQKWNEELQENEDVTVSKLGTWVECYGYHDEDNKYFEVDEAYYVAVAPQVFEGGVTVKLRINDGEELVVKSTENRVETKANVILNLGELEYTAPAEWAIAGTFNGWDTSANPMALEGEYYVARNVTGLNFTAKDGTEDLSSDTGFQFVHQGGAWKGGYGDTDTPGKLSAGSWSWYWEDGGKNIYVDGAAAATPYDIYLNPSNGKFVIVAAGADVPEDTPVEAPEVVVGYWAVVGTMSGWEDYAEMVLDGDWYVATDVKFAVSDQFKFRADADWAVNRGAAGDTDGVVIENNVETDVYDSGKNFSVAEGGYYSLYINKSATKVKVVKTADLPVSSVPDQPCDWALWAQSPDWAQIDMLTTAVPDLFVAKSVALDAYKSFLVKSSESWTTKFGTGNVNYIKANKWFAATQGDGAGDITVEAAGTYDIYFDYTTKKVYLMTEGTSYTSATEQTVSGKEPVVEEPEVTANVLYMKPNSNWYKNSKRCAAYFFNSKGNTWVSMTDSDSDGIYEVNIPSGYTFGDSVIFCSMNPDTTANNWNNKYNQTADLTIPTDGKNLFTVGTGGDGWNNLSGTWSKK